MKIFGTVLALSAVSLGAPVGAEPVNPTKELPEEAIAVVGAETISVEQFRAEMERRAHGLPGQYVTPEQRRALLDEMIEQRALVAAARAEGLDRRPDVVAAFEKILVARYRQERLDPEFDAVVVEPWEVESFYEQHKQDYAVPERYRAAIIRIGVSRDAPEEDWKAAATRADMAVEEAQSLDESTHHFGEVAVRFSEDRASRYRGGVIGWITREVAQRSKWAPELLEAIFALERPGQFGPIVRAADGVYAVRLVERERSRVRSLATLESGFRNQIAREKHQQVYERFLNEVLAEMGVQVDDTLLDSIAPPESSTTEKRPPALPAG